MALAPRIPRTRTTTRKGAMRSAKPPGYWERPRRRCDRPASRRCMPRLERCDETENTIALRGTYWRSSYLVEIPDFAPSPHDEFALAAWLVGPQCEPRVHLCGGD